MDLVAGIIICTCGVADLVICVLAIYVVIRWWCEDYRCWDPLS